MKKILSLILVMMSFAFHTMAEESKTSNSSQGIKLETDQYNTYKTGIHRAPMRIGIEAWYNAENNSIDISYDGEAEGEVFLYMDGNLIDYNSSINTSFPLPSAHGLFSIEIISETWTAQGCIQLV